MNRRSFFGVAVAAALAPFVTKAKDHPAIPIPPWSPDYEWPCEFSGYVSGGHKLYDAQCRVDDADNDRVVFQVPRQPIGEDRWRKKGSVADFDRELPYWHYWSDPKPTNP